MPRILLVDDDKVARALYGDFLSAAGHQVRAVPGLVEARAALDAERYDVVVTDLLLQGAHGMAVLQHVKEHHPGTEVVVITGLDKVEPAVRAIKGGAAEYLVKPVAPEALQHAVRRALATRQLLRENESLRRHVTLLEAGQRIATVLDAEQLTATAGGAVMPLTGARAALLFARENDGALKLLGAVGTREGEDVALAKALVPALEAGSTSALPSPAPYTRALAFSAQEGGATLGHLVLLYEQGVPEDASEAGEFLARHVALALRNLGRFAEVADLAYLDDLTRLFNTRYLHLALEREVRAAQESGGVFSLLFLDLDHFKAINDTHGHLVGSKLLVEASRVVKGCIRDEDIAARYGGDEYVLLLRATDSGGALKVAERIRRTMESHHFLAREGLSLNVTTCIGVASFPEHAQDKPTLLDLADRAMYRGKRGSRNVVYMAARDLEATPQERHSAPTG